MRTLMTGLSIGLVCGVAVTGMVGLAWPQGEPFNPYRASFENTSLFAEVLEKVRHSYVVEIDEREAIEAAINGMLTSLDPHSNYLTSEDYSEMLVQTAGEYGGLGIEVTMEDGFIRIISPMDDTPASRAGLRPGDLITGVDGRRLVGQTINDAVRFMRGAPDSPIQLTILRSGHDAFDVELVREIIQPESVTWRTENQDIGYIRVSTFNERTTVLLDEARRGLRAELGGLPRGIVLDLRNNGGGLLEQAVGVSSAFLSGGDVVSTKGRRPDQIATYTAQTGQAFRDVPVVILINGGTASAAEIVAGALQDRQRALIVGQTSFGKGSVQNIMPLGAQSGAIRLTTARYYTPAGRSIQATGIVPDIKIAQEWDRPRSAVNGWSEADLPHALPSETSHLNPSDARAEMQEEDRPPEDYAGEDYQLERALQILGDQINTASLTRRAG